MDNYETKLGDSIDKEWLINFIKSMVKRLVIKN